MSEVQHLITSRHKTLYEWEGRGSVCNYGVTRTKGPLAPFPVMHIPCQWGS